MKAPWSLGTGLFVAVVLAVVVAAVTLFWQFHGPSQERQPFIREAWLAGSQLEQLNDPGCFRGGMALDVLESRLLLGKGPAYVEATLGPPTSRAATYWHYALGQCTGFGWHHSELYVYFDSQQLVQNAGIRRTEPHSL
jgi:hypothetical protein